MQKVFILLIGLMIISISINAQELNCQIQLNDQQVEDTDKSRFQTLQSAIYEFMNNRQWTNNQFKTEERIECTISITFSKDGTSRDNYKGTIQVQSRRPVFNSSYDSPMLNILDKQVSFKWVEHDPLNFDINSYTNNLTSILAFYAYIIIGTDFDSFSPLGGTPYFNNAQTTVNNASNSGFLGWASMGSEKNRYWYLENIQNSRYEDYRNFLYRYHRKGLDQMFENLSQGRVETLNSLKLLQNVHKARIGLYTMTTLMDAKRDEFIGIFKDAQPNEQKKAKAYLMEIDAANAAEYQKMVQGSGR